VGTGFPKRTCATPKNRERIPIPLHRPGEIAAVEASRSARAAGRHGGAFADAALDQALHLVELRLADQRTHRGLRIERIADLDLFGCLLRECDGVVALRAMDEHAGRRLARLPGVGEAAQHTRMHHCCAAASGVIRRFRRGVGSAKDGVKDVCP
jgi:hypothetical protein